ncbi:MAG: hypothetical protein DMF83_08995 [Acidobacteria bacterium]|nr:MAG: hypothetical protein DMF83_08995 [Acidobacteriota bacterium]
MIVALLAALVGLVLGVGLAWLILSGVLAMSFQRARTAIRRMVERRRAARPGSERRGQERRKR